jgi:hypothetical protein
MGTVFISELKQENSKSPLTEHIKIKLTKVGKNCKINVDL